MPSAERNRLSRAVFLPRVYSIFQPTGYEFARQQQPEEWTTYLVLAPYTQDGGGLEFGVATRVHSCSSSSYRLITAVDCQAQVVCFDRAAGKITNRPVVRKQEPPLHARNNGKWALDLSAC